MIFYAYIQKLSTNVSISGAQSDQTEINKLYKIILVSQNNLYDYAERYNICFSEKKNPSEKQQEAVQRNSPHLYSSDVHY